MKVLIDTNVVLDILLHRQPAVAKEAIKRLLQVFYPATVTDKNIYQALELNWDDFEDSVQYIIGEGLAVDYIITRNLRDYASSLIPAVTPDNFLEIVANIEQ